MAETLQVRPTSRSTSVCLVRVKGTDEFHTAGTALSELRFDYPNCHLIDNSQPEVQIRANGYTLKDGHTYTLVESKYFTHVQRLDIMVKALKKQVEQLSKRCNDAESREQLLIDKLQEKNEIKLRDQYNQVAMALCDITNYKPLPSELDGTKSLLTLLLSRIQELMVKGRCLVLDEVQNCSAAIAEIIKHLDQVKHNIHITGHLVLLGTPELGDGPPIIFDGHILGRIDGNFKISPFNFFEMMGLISNVCKTLPTSNDLLSLWSCFNGIPEYYRQAFEKGILLPTGRVVDVKLHNWMTQQYSENIQLLTQPELSIIYSIPPFIGREMNEIEKKDPSLQSLIDRHIVSVIESPPLPKETSSFQYITITDPVISSQIVFNKRENNVSTPQTMDFILNAGLNECIKVLINNRIESGFTILPDPLLLITILNSCEEVKQATVNPKVTESVLSEYELLSKNKKENVYTNQVDYRYYANRDIACVVRNSVDNTISVFSSRLIPDQHNRMDCLSFLEDICQIVSGEENKIRLIIFSLSLNITQRFNLKQLWQEALNSSLTESTTSTFSPLLGDRIRMRDKDKDKNQNSNDTEKSPPRAVTASQHTAAKHLRIKKLGLIQLEIYCLDDYIKTTTYPHQIYEQGSYSIWPILIRPAVSNGLKDICNNSNITLIYGYRRVGKTTTIQHMNFTDRDNIYISL